jgi:predicted transcriptional regulator
MPLNQEIKDAVNWDAETVSMEDSLRTVIRKLVRSRTSALVVKMGDIVIGFVTDMDIIDSIDRGADLDETKADSFMIACELITTRRSTAQPCIQLHEEESVRNAFRLMSGAAAHNLMVSGENDTCVGTVSITDLLGLIAK